MGRKNAKLALIVARRGPLSDDYLCPSPRWPPKSRRNLSSDKYKTKGGPKQRDRRCAQSMTEQSQRQPTKPPPNIEGAAKLRAPCRVYRSQIFSAAGAQFVALSSISCFVDRRYYWYGRDAIPIVISAHFAATTLGAPPSVMPDGRGTAGPRPSKAPRGHRRIYGSSAILLGRSALGAPHIERSPRLLLWFEESYLPC